MRILSSLGLASSTKKNQQDNISVQRGRDVYLPDGQRHQQCERVISHPYLTIKRLSGSEKKTLFLFHNSSIRTGVKYVRIWQLE